MSLHETAADRAEHPVDTVERLAAQNEWTFERDEDDEISISAAGRWTNYDVAFTWLPELEALHVACAFELKPALARQGEAARLVAMVNEQLWVGHFDFWPSRGVVMFRHSLLLAGGVEATGRQCAGLLEAALEACERHYQAFQFVAWAGKSAREALDATMFETVGEA